MQKPPRNPRRAYDKDGAEIEPSRIGKMRADGEVTVSVHCGRCNRHVVLSTEGMPDDLAVPDIPVTYPLTCSACGSKRYTVMHDMTAVYDRILVMKGRESGLPADREVLRLPTLSPQRSSTVPSSFSASAPPASSQACSQAARSSEPSG